MPSSPLLAAPGAVAADEPDTGIAAHYGDPFAEQRALTSSSGLVDRGNRGVIRITGPDRLGWLHSLTTQHLERLEPQHTEQALVLSPNGHVQHHLTLVDDGTEIWAHVEPGTAPALIEFLESMRFMLRVEAEDVTGEYAVMSLLGPGAAALVPAGLVALRDRFGIDILVPREKITSVADQLTGSGARLAGIWAYEALRIAAHRPRLGVDTDHRTIPHEAGWIGAAVHLEKGCYRGQETVARVHNLGHPPRRLVMLQLDGSADRLPARGEKVEMDGAAVGTVGSSARHYEQGPIALALVKRTTPVEATLLADQIAAAQEIVVPPDAGGQVKVTLRRH